MNILLLPVMLRDDQPPDFLKGLSADTFLGKFVSLAVRWLGHRCRPLRHGQSGFWPAMPLSQPGMTPKSAGAWARNLANVIGVLAVAAGSFVLAAIFGKIIFWCSYNI